MGTLQRAEAVPLDRLVLFDAMLKTLSFKGPTVYVHVLPAQRPQEVIVFAWRDENDEVETERPRFGAKGTVDQAFGALKQWLAREGWIEA